MKRQWCSTWSCTISKFQASMTVVQKNIENNKNSKPFNNKRKAHRGLCLIGKSHWLLCYQKRIKACLQQQLVSLAMQSCMCSQQTHKHSWNFIFSAKESVRFRSCLKYGWIKIIFSVWAINLQSFLLLHRKQQQHYVLPDFD